MTKSVTSVEARVELDAILTHLQCGRLETGRQSDTETLWSSVHHGQRITVVYDRGRHHLQVAGAQ